MKKFSKKLIYHHLIRDIGIAIFIGFFVFSEIMGSFEESSNTITDGNFKQSLIIGIVAGVLYYIINAIYRVLFYKTSEYEVNNEGIVCRRGVLFRRKSFLDYTKMHTVNKKQGLIQKIFGIAYLMIDSGSTNTAYSAEIWIVEEADIIDQIMEKISLKQKGLDVEIETNEGKIEESKEETKENLYEYTTIRKCLYSLVTTILSLFSILVIAFLISILLAILYLLINAERESILEILMIILIGGAIATIGISLLTFLGSLVNSLIAYHNFKIYQADDSIEINYGLFVRNSNVFKLKKIRAIKIKQNIIQRLFKVVAIDIEVIGYGDINSSEKDKVSNILIPICKETEANEYIAKIIPQYLPVEKEYHSPKYFPHISWVTLILSIIFGVAEIIALPWFICYNEIEGLTTFTTILVFSYFLTLGIIYINKAIKVKNEGLGVNEEKLTIYHGGFNKTITTILKKDLIGIEDVTTPYRVKKGIYSYVIHFRSNMNTNTAQIDCIGEEAKEELLTLIKF